MMSQTERIINEWFNQINDMNDENASLRHELKELREYVEDIEVLSGEVWLENDKLKKELEESRESLGYMETAYTKFQQKAYQEILDLKRLLGDLNKENERLLQGSTSTFDEYWSSQAHRCQEEMEFWRNKAEELGGMLEEEKDTSEYWHDVANDFEQEAEELKNMLSDSDDQNESVMSIHREERWHEKQKELMKIIDRQYFEALARDKRVTELEAQLGEEKDVCEYWYNVSTNREDVIAQLTSEIAHWEWEYNRVQSLWDYAQKEKEQLLYAAGEARKEAYVNGMEDAEKLYMKALKNAMGGNNE